MVQNILKTDNNNYANLIVRVTLALVILPHGLQKLFGVFGGFGFNASMNYFTGTVGVPWIVGLLVILGESVGAVMLLFGFLSRFAAASLGIIMIGAGATFTGNGFFMNWFGNQAGEGFEFFILTAGMAVAIVLKGGGAWAADTALRTALSKNKQQVKPQH